VLQIKLVTYHSAVSLQSPVNYVARLEKIEAVN